MTANWHQPVTLAGPTLILAPLRLADAPEFLGALGPPEVAAEVLRHMSYGPPVDVAATRAVIAAALADLDRMAYSQRIADTGELVGTTSFYEMNPAVRSLGIGHTWIARPHWRTRVNTESKLIMLTRAFEELGAERVVWHTDIRNTRSQAAIERLGAIREGVLRHHRIRPDGTWRDTVQYSMLSTEWPAVRDRLQAAAILRS
jgi:RimJ/RimL family protein N-acetyltransferase